MLENKYKQLRISEHIDLYDKIISKDHILRKIKENVDFSFVNKLVEKEYCENFGRPAHEPELMFKLLFLEIKDSLSDREVIKRAETDDFGDGGKKHLHRNARARRKRYSTQSLERY